MSRPRPRLRVEELESRTLLTGTSLALPALTGTAGGTYALGPSLPTTGTTYELAGTGTVGPLGRVAVSGFLQAARFISPGHAGGLVTLSNARGTVQLQPSGPSRPGGARLPASLRFQVVWGTGAYARLSRGGSANLSLTARSHTGGTFTLTFGP